MPAERDTKLLERCRDKGFTPGARDVAALLETWRAVQGQRREAKLVVRALARGDGGVARKLQRDLAEAGGPERAMRVRALSQIARRIELPSLPGLLDAALSDSEPRVVREAVRAIAKLDEAVGAGYEDVLIELARHAALPEQRAAVEALGRVGSEQALELIRELDSEDPELQRRLSHARTLLSRRATREATSQVIRERALPHPVTVRLRCRGAAKLVAAEIEDRLPEAEALVRHGDRTLNLRWSGSLAELQTVRTALDFGLVFALPPGTSLAERIVAGLESTPLVEALRAWTEGPVRFRLSFARGGSRSALAWAVARGLDERDAALTNDSRGANWTIEVDEARNALIALPRHADPRFDYREVELPAASHPTMAALMARVVAPRPGQLIWDPYCGGGTELIECGLLSPGLDLVGTDTDARAIAACRANLGRASIEAATIAIDHRDAYAGSPGPASASAIVTNPPMGRRVAIRGGVHESLRQFVAHAAKVLLPGGRLVWVTPAARVSADAGLRAGLRVHDHDTIDMSGLRVVLQVMQRPT